MEIKAFMTSVQYESSHSALSEMTFAFKVFSSNVRKIQITQDVIEDVEKAIGLILEKHHCEKTGDYSLAEIRQEQIETILAY